MYPPEATSVSVRHQDLLYRGDEHWVNDGGEGGIRTPDTLSGTLAFEASAFNHSATSPDLLAAMRMTIINEWLAGRYFPQVSPQTLGSDEYLLNVNPPRRYTPDLRSVAFVESRPC